MVSLFSMLTITLGVVVAPAPPTKLSGAPMWADSARREIEVARAQADTTRLEGARVMIERALAAHPDDALLLHYLGYAGYREAEARFSAGGLAALRPLVSATQQALERSATLKPLPETYALIASVLGQRIRLDPSQASVFGRQASSQMHRAVELGPKNPRVWLTMGRRSIFVPAAYGGGLDHAETCLKRALELFAKDTPAPPLPAWGEAEAHLWLGQAYERRGKHDEARREYARALELEPENGWVAKVLLPRVEKAQ